MLIIIFIFIYGTIYNIYNWKIVKPGKVISMNVKKENSK